MTGYKEDKTQEERILEFLKERGDQGVYAWEMTNTDVMRERGGAIMQYNARIYGLREKGYDIKNVEPGHFVLKEAEPKQEALL